MLGRNYICIVMSFPLVFIAGNSGIHPELMLFCPFHSSGILQMVRIVIIRCFKAVDMSEKVMGINVIGMLLLWIIFVNGMKRKRVSIG